MYYCGTVSFGFQRSTGVGSEADLRALTACR
jgi:hypothetical protein